jgi:integral membrane protein
MNIKTVLGQLQLLAILEGISYISFGLTMPLKYSWKITEPNYYVGMAHGVLFIAYCMWVVLVQYDKKLPFKTTAILLLSSLVPFMTFWAERKILKKVN